MHDIFDVAVPHDSNRARLCNLAADGGDTGLVHISLEDSPILCKGKHNCDALQ